MKIFKIRAFEPEIFKDVGIHSVMVPDPENNSAYFLRGVRRIAFVAKALGLIPSDFFLAIRQNGQVYKRTCNFSTTYSLLLCVVSLINLLYEVWITSKETKGQMLATKMEFMQAPMYKITVFFIFAYFFAKMWSLVEVMKKWEKINSAGTVYRTDRNFPRFCPATLILVLGTCIAENLLFDVQLFTEEGSSTPHKNATLLETYYWNSGHIVTSFIPYFAPLSVIVTILSKVSTLVWNVSDIIVICLCRALTDRFRAFNEYVMAKLLTTLPVLKGISGQGALEQIRSEFQVLVDLSEETTRFLSPLAISCYIYNIYLIILNIFRWVNPGGIGDEERQAYVYVSFLQFSLRVILVTYHAANVHHSTEAIQKTLEQVPDWLYDSAVERLEKQLSRNPVGISLFGTFRVTRTFFISIVSFLFTTEIVLLQTATTSGPGSSGSIKSSTNKDGAMF